MRLLLGISWIIDHITAFIGKVVSWLILVAVIVSSVNAVVRKVLNESSNSWLELQWYLFGATFFLAAAWTLARREHIRIDIVSSLLPRRVRHWLELGGHILFLMPLCLLTLYFAWPFFGSSVVGTVAWNGLHGFPDQAASGHRRASAAASSTRSAASRRCGRTSPPDGRWGPG